MLSFLLNIYVRRALSGALVTRPSTHFILLGAVTDWPLVFQQAPSTIVNQRINLCLTVFGWRGTNRSNFGQFLLKNLLIVKNLPILCHLAKLHSSNINHLIELLNESNCKPRIDQPLHPVG